MKVPITIVKGATVNSALYFQLLTLKSPYLLKDSRISSLTQKLKANIATVSGFKDQSSLENNRLEDIFQKIVSFFISSTERFLCYFLMFINTAVMYFDDN